MLLAVKDLHACYGTSHVLQGISLGVKEGEIVGLLGRNGMGKSTTLKAIMGLVKPRSGSVMVKGRDVTGYPPHRVARAGIGYVPEERRIFPSLTVLENLGLGVKSRWISRAGNRNSWDLERIFSHFPMLKERRHNPGRHLSVGEQQMLAIGRTLMGNPELLLVDEPTEGLAPLMAKEVWNILTEINRSGVSILLVERNLKVATSLATHVYVMGKGHIGFAGTGEELKAHREIQEKYLEVGS
jgi:branched-chain amino acid transport system ATP-binding protein